MLEKEIEKLSKKKLVNVLLNVIAIASYAEQNDMPVTSSEILESIHNAVEFNKKD